MRTAVKQFANGFQARHIGEHDNPDGTINMKIHNVFIAALGAEVRYYTSLVRSFDSSLGNMLELLAIEIARLNFEVHSAVEGSLSESQTDFIGRLLEEYKRRNRLPQIADYQVLRDYKKLNNTEHKRRQRPPDKSGGL